jgi:hypothetical protein
METLKDLSEETVSPYMEPVKASKDIDPAGWLAHDDSLVTGSVEITVKGEPRTLQIAAITERENNDLLKASKKFNKLDPKNPKMDFTEYRLRAIAYSLNKANPGSLVTAESLQGRLTGQLTKIQEAVFKLSGLETETRTEVADFFA